MALDKTFRQGKGMGWAGWGIEEATGSSGFGVGPRKPSRGGLHTAPGPQPAAGGIERAGVRAAAPSAGPSGERGPALPPEPSCLALPQLSLFFVSWFLAKAAQTLRCLRRGEAGWERLWGPAGPGRWPAAGSGAISCPPAASTGGSCKSVTEVLKASGKRR